MRGEANLGRGESIIREEKLRQGNQGRRDERTERDKIQGRGEEGGEEKIGNCKMHGAEFCRA